MQANLKSRFSYIILVALVLATDRISKFSIVAHYDLGEPAPIIDGLFNITYVQNAGVAFGILNTFSSPTKVLFLCLVAGIAAVVVIVYSLRNDPRKRMLQGALALILAGALGNLFDRVRYGYVIDFL